MNKNQKIILTIFISIIIFFIALMIANSVGYTAITKTKELPSIGYLSKYKYSGGTTTIYQGNPFDCGRTWYIWLLALVFCCIFEYKLFADKKKKDK